MQPIEWTTGDLVFIPELDADHRKVFRDIEKARQALANGTPANQIGFYLWRLSKTFSTHVASEERSMRSCEYDALQWHQQQHHAGRAKLALLMEAAHQKDLRSVSETLEEFTHWLRDHVGLADRMFAAHLRNDRRERLVS